MPTEEGVDVTAALQCEITHRSDPECSIRRLLLMSYFPSGFWSRLITRILADDAIVDIVRAFFIMPKEVRYKQLYALEMEAAGFFENLVHIC
jgi:hypothetical protein